MMTHDQANAFAEEWIAAWNSHDLEHILDHYAENISLTSPVAARLLGDASGSVSGKAALRAYFGKGLAAYPELTFRLLDVMSGLTSVVLCYVNQISKKSAEFMELGPDGKVIRVIAHYSA